MDYQAKLAILDQAVVQDNLVHRVRKDRLDQLDLKVNKVLKEILGQQEHLEITEQLDSQDRLDHRDKMEMLDHQVLMEMLVQLAILELRVNLDHKEMQVSLGRLVIKDH